MDNKNQLSTTAAADGLQLGSGLRRIVCLAALLVIFVASGVRAAGTYTVTVYNGATISSNDYKALSALCSPLGLMNGNTSGGKTEFFYQSKDHYFTCNTSTYKCSVPATTLPIEKSFPITAYKTILQQSGTYTWLANYDAIKLVLAVAVDGQNFPDTNFRNWVKAQSYGSDGILTKAEIAAVTKIEVKNQSISNLKGIEYFTALTNLNCSNNQLTELDVSKNKELTWLGCWDNQLTSLDVSNCTALGMLWCNNNQLTSLNVSGCTALIELYCYESQLTKLDVSGCSALTLLNCRDNNLTELNVSGCTALGVLRCRENKMTELDVSGCTALWELEFDNNQLAALDVSKNTNLVQLYCFNNQLTSLDVSGCPALKVLWCFNNQLTSLDVSGYTALTNLRCEYNQLTSLNVSGCAVLKTLYCNNNQIRGTAMTNLVNSLPDWKTASEEGTLLVYRDETPAGNMMTKVQVKIATDKNWNVQMWDEEEYNWVPYEGETLDGIEISEENFPDDNFRAYVSSEDIDRNRDGYLSDDEIVATTEINVSYLNISDLKGIEFFNGLKELNCSYNQLTSLDVSNNTALTRLYCYSNRIRGTDMTKLVNRLPDRKSASEEGTLWVYYDETPEGNMMTTKQVKIAREKNWNVVMWDDDYEDFIPYEGETLDGIEISEANFPDDNFREYVGSKNIDRDGNGYLSDEEIVATREIDVSEMEIESLKGIEYFKKLEELSCFINQLTSLDVSDCSALRFLNCFGNQLTSLDLSKNTALTYLDCGYNQLTSLDLSKNMALTSLICFNNQLTSLDMSHDTALERLECYSNQIRGAAMTTLVNSLPDRKSASEKGTFEVYYDETPDGNLMTKLQVKIATDKNWNVWMWDDEEVYDWVPYEGEIIPGDANGNGVVDAQDIATVRDYILGLDPQSFSFESANLNGDSAVDIQDLTKLIQLLTE